ncbi:beta-1,3-glucan-binding protein-like [Mytilus californianus]|uniref:beta-1,3-glucan-binding protein-like n=1 Tax=Mytilus californianus TaxID=6549 RepID=UPI0022457F01|nr:beta-1,3-glucan-binding protein-like [Mytilus californianus]
MYTSGAIVPPKTIRSVTAFRDDFNSWNANNYQVACTAWGGGNNELQVYTPGQANLFTKNGHLYIKPTLTVNHPDFDEGKLYHGQMDLNGLWGYCTQASNSGCNKHGGQDILPPVMSGYITTKAAIKYGRINVRAKLPKADWTWPAIWTLPRDKKYGGWPQSGAMDIMESRGNWFKKDYQYAYQRPWTDSSRQPKRDFWEHRNQWQSSWQGDNAAMVVDYVEMIQY